MVCGDTYLVKLLPPFAVSRSSTRPDALSLNTRAPVALLTLTSSVRVVKCTLSPRSVQSNRPQGSCGTTIRLARGAGRLSPGTASTRTMLSVITLSLTTPADADEASAT